MEGSGPAPCRAHPQDRVEDTGVGDQNDRAGAHRVYEDKGKDDHLTGVGVGAHELQHGAGVAEEVVNPVGSAEGTPKRAAGVDGGAEKGQQVGQGHQPPPDVAGDDRHVEQGVADGNIAVVGHGGQEVTLDSGKESKEVELHRTASECNGFVLR